MKEHGGGESIGQKEEVREHKMTRKHNTGKGRRDIKSDGRREKEGWSNKH